jgi:hypothetical protein
MVTEAELTRVTTARIAKTSILDFVGEGPLRSGMIATGNHWDL